VVVTGEVQFPAESAPGGSCVVVVPVSGANGVTWPASQVIAAVPPVTVLVALWSRVAVLFAALLAITRAQSGAGLPEAPPAPAMQTFMPTGSHRGTYPKAEPEVTVRTFEFIVLEITLFSCAVVQVACAQQAGTASRASASRHMSTPPKGEVRSREDCCQPGDCARHRCNDSPGRRRCLSFTVRN